jgi:hypothetical protein
MIAAIAARKVAYLVAAAAFLTGCSTIPDIVLRNSAGQTARCEGSFVATGWGRSQMLSRLQRECVDDYQRQGYERVPEREAPK